MYTKCFLLIAVLLLTTCNNISLGSRQFPETIVNNSPAPLAARQALPVAPFNPYTAHFEPLVLIIHASDEDAKDHQFHFTRLQKRKHSRLIHFIVRLLVVLLQLSVFISGFVHAAAMYH